MAILIALGCLLFWLRGRQEPNAGPEASSGRAGGRSIEALADGERSSSARSQSSSRKIPDGNLTTHEPEQLKDFYLIKCTGHRVSLQRALKLLDEAYRDSCYLSLEKPLDLKYIVEGTSDKRISFSIQGKKWSDALNYIAALAGMEVKHEGLKVRLVPLEMKHDEPFHASIPDGLHEKLLQDLIDRGEWDANDSDPGLLSLLRLYGISENTMISFLPNDTIFVFPATSQDPAIIRALFQLEEKKPQLFRMESKIITSAEELELPKGGIDAAAAGEWLKGIKQTEGTEIMAAPSLVSANDQSATLEVKQGQGDDWTGLQITYKTQPVGLKLASETVTEIRPVAENLRDQTTESQWLVDGGQSQIQSIGYDKGRYYYQMTSIQKLSPTGREQFARVTVTDAVINPDRTAHPEAKAVPGKAGFVFSPYTNRVVDVRDLPKGVLIADPEFPMSEQKFFRVP